MPEGSSRWTSVIVARTFLMTSSVFAVGRTQMPMKTARLPEKRTSESYDSAPSATSAT